MRYIDTSSIIVPTDWPVVAKQNKFDPLWSFFKRNFENLNGKKCWYSESDNSGSINPIDHFRPKANNVAKLSAKNADLEPFVWSAINSQKRSGYSFLELVFSNYRYSCDITNSLNKNDKGIAKGKSNYFPLQSMSPYGTNSSNINLELICLLDPCVFNDPQLLFFKDTGFIEPHFSVKTGSWEYCRVKVSIEVYNLHYYVFLEKRILLWNSCKESIELANILFFKVNKSDEDVNHLAYHIKELRKRINKNKEFSAVAIDCIKFYKGQSAFLWLDHHFPDRLLDK